MIIMLHKNCIYINLISHLEHNLCNITVKKEILGEEICERGRFVCDFLKQEGLTGMPHV